MKNLLKKYTSFTRMERIGIICLSGIIIILLVVRVSMPYWVKTETNPEEEKRLIAAWEVYKRSQPKVKTTDTADGTTGEYIDASDDNETPLPAVININTADSATLVRLKGIGPAMAHKMIIYRKEHGSFKKTEDILNIRSIPEKTFEALKKHLSIADTLE